MAREVQIVTWCDQHLSEGQHTPGSEYAGLNSAGVRVILDLCEEHAQEFIKPTLVVFDAHGRIEAKPERTPRSSRTRKQSEATDPCPDCGAMFGTVQAMGMHRWRKHGIRSPYKRQPGEVVAEQPGEITEEAS